MISQNIFGTKYFSGHFNESFREYRVLARLGVQIQSYAVS